MLVALLIVVIILLAGVFGFFAYRNSLPLENQSATQQKPAETTIEDKTITDHAKPFTIDVTYPYIEGATGFNTTIKNVIDAQIADFKKISLENDTAVKENDPQNYADYPREYILNISYKKGLVSQDLASVIFSVYSFTGGAHGNAYFVAVNYNTKDNKEVTLADLFAGQQNYIKTISDYCIAELNKQMVEKIGTVEGSWIKDGAGPKADNFSEFLVNKDTVTFYFAPYQVAAWAAGDFQVTMPRPK